jgi:hypothetical protein
MALCSWAWLGCETEAIAKASAKTTTTSLSVLSRILFSP